MNTFTTPKGTELPLQDLKGKDYLQPMYRIVWMREEHPLWTIQTEIISHDKQTSLIYAKILDETGRLIASAHKEASGGDFTLEKSETGAIGRALANAGFGTAFASLDLDEGDVVVDAPAEKKIVLSKETKKTQAKESNQHLPGKGGPGSYALKMGVHKNKRLDEIGAGAISDYIGWLKNKATEAVRNSQSGKNDLFAAELYLRTTGVTPTEADLFGNRGPEDTPPADYRNEPWPDSAYDSAKNN